MEKVVCNCKSNKLVQMYRVMPTWAKATTGVVASVLIIVGIDRLTGRHLQYLFKKKDNKNETAKTAEE